MMLSSVYPSAKLSQTREVIWISLSLYVIILPQAFYYSNESRLTQHNALASSLPRAVAQILEPTLTVTGQNWLTPSSEVNVSTYIKKVLDAGSCLPVILKLSLPHCLHQEDRQCRFLHLAFLLPVKGKYKSNFI